MLPALLFRLPTGQRSKQYEEGQDTAPDGEEEMRDDGAPCQADAAATGFALRRLVANRLQ